MPEIPVSLRLRVLAKNMRLQVERMASEHKTKKGMDFAAAHFSAASYIRDLEKLAEELALEDNTANFAIK